MILGLSFCFSHRSYIYLHITHLYLGATFKCRVAFEAGVMFLLFSPSSSADSVLLFADISGTDHSLMLLMPFCIALIPCCTFTVVLSCSRTCGVLEEVLSFSLTSLIIMIIIKLQMIYCVCVCVMFFCLFVCSRTRILDVLVCRSVCRQENNRRV